MAGFRRALNRFDRELRVLGAVAGVYAAFFLGYGLSRFLNEVRLDAAKPAYYHYEFVELRLCARDRALNREWLKSPPLVRVLRQGLPVKSVAGITQVKLSFDPAASAWVGRWPCPWNAPDGEYLPELVAGPELASRVSARPFSIRRRPVAKIPERFVVLTWESVRPLDELRVPAPDGSTKDWRGLLDWTQYVGADAFWMLGGQTPGPGKGQLWVTRNLDKIPEVARECHRRGLKFGVYAMNYLTMSSVNRVPGYEYALDAEDGEIRPTRAISIGDPQRPRDVALLLKRFRDDPGVDFLGLDYVRNALGGLELADDFFAEMPGVEPPPGWAKLGRRERMLWFAHKKALRKDSDFIDAWQWWRAHRVSLVIRSIKEKLGGVKPLWAFTLTWERGWQHGQDVVMFRDAGVDLDALMLYEADAAQFEWLINDWRAYLKKADAQVLVGDVVDWGLHQRSPRGPGELGYRLRRAVSSLHPDGPPAGLFVHDLERALHGRLGPWSTKDWLDEARAVIHEFKKARRPSALDRLPPSSGSRSAVGAQRGERT